MTFVSDVFRFYRNFRLIIIARKEKENRLKRVPFKKIILKICESGTIYITERVIINVKECVTLELLS